MEIEKVEKLDNPMTEEELKILLEKKRGKYIEGLVQDFNNGILHILSYKGVDRFKSVRRAIRRGNVDMLTGVIYPKRPFNNRKPTPCRKFNESRKEIYGRLTRKSGQL